MFPDSLTIPNTFTLEFVLDKALSYAQDKRGLGVILGATTSDYNLRLIFDEGHL